MGRMFIILGIVGAEIIGCAHNTAKSGVASTQLDPSNEAADQKLSSAGVAKIQRSFHECADVTKDAGTLAGYFIASPFVFFAVISAYSQAERDGGMLP